MDSITAVLFDIDGTLLDMRGAGRRSFVLALERVFGWKDDIAYVNFAGNTDLNVLRQVLAHHQEEADPARMARFLAQVPLELEREAQKAELILYPGVRDLLEALSDHPRVLLGLVTGNIEACARIKLRQFDLHGHFVLGGFGDHHADRAEIARHALNQVQAALPPDSTLDHCCLIGDTPFDVAAAISIGAVPIGVATGKFTADELKAAGAIHVLDSLADTQDVLNRLGLSTG